MNAPHESKAINDSLMTSSPTPAPPVEPPQSIAAEMASLPSLLDTADGGELRVQPQRLSVCELPRDDTLEMDVFKPSLSQARADRLTSSGEAWCPSDGDTDGRPSSSTRLASSGPSTTARPNLVERYVHFLALKDAFASSLPERTLSQERVLNSSEAVIEKLSHLSLSGARPSAVASPSLSPSSSLSPAVDGAPYLVEPVFIQSSTVNLLLKRLSDDVIALQAAHRQEIALKVLHDSSPSLSPKTVSATAMDASLSVVLRMPYHTHIPKRLDLPLWERCPFCQKHDSMCSRCHAKWAAIKQDICETRLKPAYTALPLVKRTSLAFLMSAFGNGDLLTMQLFHDAALVTRAQARYRVVSLGEAWRAALTPSTPLHHEATAAVPSNVVTKDPARRAFADHQEDQHGSPQNNVLLWLQGRFDGAGTVHALHVALAHRNAQTAKALLDDANVHFLLSTKDNTDPLAFLHCPVRDAVDVPIPDALLRVLNGSRECRLHIRSELAKAVIREHHYAEARPLVDDMLHENPEDERGVWLSAVLAFAEKRVSESQRYLQQLLHRASQKPLFFLDKGQIHRLLAEVSRSVRPQTTRVGPLESRVGSFSLRRLPFRIVSGGVLPFCTPVTLLRVHEATKMPLLRAATVAIAALSPPALLHAVLTSDAPHFGELVLTLIDELPATEPVMEHAHDTPAVDASERHTDDAARMPQALVKDGTLRPIHVHVLSMTDFSTLVIKVSMAGKRSHAFTAFLHAHDNPTSLFDQLVGPGNPYRRCLDADEVVLSRVFTIHRTSVGSSWHATPYTEWELDLVGTAALPSS